MKGYEVNQPWDDPFDHLTERRKAPRFPYKMKITIVSSAPEKRGRLVGPGIVTDLSLTGAKLVTKHKLVPGHHVDLELQTESTVEGPCLPSAFSGSAEVVRVAPGPDGRSDVALSFDDSLSLNMEFALYIDMLQAKSRIMNAGHHVA